MKSLGIIFSNVESESLHEITRKRTTASIPFGGRYRLIDFALSNLVSAEITNVAVLAQRNYQSLMDHLGSGKDWDLSRKNGGLVIFPPFGYYKNDSMSTTRLESLKTITGYINKQKAEYVVLMDSDSVNAVNITEVIKEHEENHADITVIYKRDKVTADLSSNVSITMDSTNRVIGATLKSEVGKKANISINIWVITKSVLLGLIEEAISKGQTNLIQEIIYPNITGLRVFGYEYTGTYMHISNMENYFKHNMELLSENTRRSLFEQENHGIYTKIRDSAPTKYGYNVSVENSFIADGCEIEGTVINSILFRGVKVGKNSVVKNAILMQDTVIGSNVEINCVITDKNVTISDRNKLSGCEKHPYYIGKNARV